MSSTKPSKDESVSPTKRFLPCTLYVLSPISLLMALPFAYTFSISSLLYIHKLSTFTIIQIPLASPLLHFIPIPMLSPLILLHLLHHHDLLLFITIPKSSPPILLHLLHDHHLLLQVYP